MLFHRALLLVLAISFIFFSSASARSDSHLARSTLSDLIPDSHFPIIEDCLENAHLPNSLNPEEVSMWEAQCSEPLRPLHMQATTSPPFQPTEIHLGYLNDPTSMEVIWVTGSAYPNSDSVAMFNTIPCSDSRFNASATTVRGVSKPCPTVGYLPYKCEQYNALLTPLTPLTKYYYTVGSQSTGHFSQCYSFVSAPTAELTDSQYDPFYFVFYGDQGIIPWGKDVAKAVTNEHLNTPISLTLHIGDLCYAGTGRDGEIEFLWDAWLNQNQPYAAEMPYMVTVGNHEKYYNFTSYRERFNMPNPAGTKFWFAFQYGPVYFISISTEHDFSVGSPQHAWVAQQLQWAAKQKGQTFEWLIVSGHRPFYSSDSSEVDQHTPGSPLLRAYEDLFVQSGVDLVMGGHMHCQEWVYPNYNGTVWSGVQPGDKTFVNPPYPLYVTQGNAGIAVIPDRFFNPQPVWSAYRTADYGYGLLTFSQSGKNSTILYQMKFGDKIFDQFEIVHQRK